MINARNANSRPDVLGRTRESSAAEGETRAGQLAAAARAVLEMLAERHRPIVDIGQTL